MENSSNKILSNGFEILKLIKNSNRRGYGILCTTSDTHYSANRFKIKRTDMEWLEKEGYLSVLAQPNRENEYRISLTAKGWRVVIE